VFGSRKSNNKNIKKYLTQSQAFFTFFCLTGKNFYAFAGTVFLPCQVYINKLIKVVINSLSKNRESQLPYLKKSICKDG